MRPRLCLMVLSISFFLEAQSEAKKETALTFMGHPVVIYHPKQINEFFVEGSASICLHGDALPKCYTAPKDFGRNAKVERVKLDKKSEALLFSVASGGVSGFAIHLALLRPGDGGALENFLLESESISNQSQFRFLSEPAISPAKILVTADYLWGINEGHFGPHRFMISSYIWQYDFDLETFLYAIADRYMTVKTYDLESKINVIMEERNELRHRLRRVVQAKTRKAE